MHRRPPPLKSVNMDAIYFSLGNWEETCASRD